jgi:hypothetical protein
LARPLSWLPFVRELHRSVVDSVRSHYDCRDIQNLFKVQARSAQKLIEMMPRHLVGSTLLVERDDLATFLKRVREAESPAKLFTEILTKPPGVTRKKLRSALIRHDRDANMTSLPDSIDLRRGRLEVNFRTPVQLAEALLAISKVIEMEDFERDFCFEQPVPRMDPKLLGEGDALLEELRKLELERSKSGHQMSTTKEELLAMPSLQGVDMMAENPPLSAIPD